MPNTGGYPDGMSQKDHDDAHGRDAEGDEITYVTPIKKHLKVNMEVLFGATEGREEARNFGIKPKGED